MAIVTKIITNEVNVIDLTTELYGDLSYAFKLIEDNSFLSSILDTVLVGEQITWDNEIVFLDKTKAIPKDVVAGPVEKTIRVRNNQNVFDLSLQLYGSIEGVFSIIQRNPAIDNINQLDLSNIDLVYTEQSSPLPVFFKKNKIFITTGAGLVGARQFDESFNLSFL